ncbi:hypothetical protein GDO86_003398 [Hymenochirus boettgeri]|uniref:Myosin motor domain-containing protein n=1 Tax=Hymenochirus boettgeri TaxID=247094 RepID=A0A8T2K0R5_9PIPI|nr:hypothetical protein GDO86_003398 [Hymenochirus boettgeri]
MAGLTCKAGAREQHQTKTKSKLPDNRIYLNKSFEEEVKAFLVDEKQLHLYDDLTKVNPVTTAIVLKCLQSRYSAGIFYTNAGCTVVAVNPFQPVFKLYSSEVMKEYHSACHLQECKPHVFIVAEQAYRKVQNQIQPVNQSIIVSGESGAGKTWTSRCLMKFYATVAAATNGYIVSEMVERIESKVLDSNPVMEAFGNACTLRNNNSSRFGKYIQIQFNRSQEITGASIQTYLLEKTRVSHQAPLERNFHIFYQITKGASKHEREEWNLPEGAKFTWLPNSERNLEEDCFETTKCAMLHLGIDWATQNNIFKILSGLMHLGNIHFSDFADENQPCEVLHYSEEYVNVTAKLLKISADHLLERLRIRTITAGKQQVFKKPCKKSECETRRDCLAKTIYARLFEWLVTEINESITAESSQWNNFIENSLEQLCINYANEKLQQHFVSHYLKAQQDEYAAEGLEWSFIRYQDNQGCVDLIEGSPISIFSLLNEECRLNRSSNAQQLQSRLEKALSHNKFIGRDTFCNKPNFVITHYAGKVSYHIEEMTEKNKDPVPQELIQLLQESDDCLLQKLFSSESNKTVDLVTHSRATGVTVVYKFKGSLESLMQILHCTAPHYIRCIKPNVDCQAMVFRQPEVLSQLEACGIVETINISAAGFPIRISFESFLERYGIITFEKQQGTGFVEETCKLQSKLHDVLHTIFPYEMVESKLRNTLIHCGTTKVFLTHLTMELLEERRSVVLSQKAACIQCCWRRYRQKKLAKQNWAATTIQAAIRSWMTRKYIKKLHCAASIIKISWKKWKEKMETLAAAELDDSLQVMKNQLFSSVPGSLVKNVDFLRDDNQQEMLWTHKAIFKFGIIGLALCRATTAWKYNIINDGFNRNRNLLTSLPLLIQNNGHSMTVYLSEPGITSIRARPLKGSVKFHYRKSPLHFANTCPGVQNFGMTGFNEILLEKQK